MDAVEQEPADGVRCDGCGYDRRGLPAGAACPECGEGPPAMVPATAAGDVSRTAGEVAWARSVAVGLGLLLVSSYYAVQVLVLMPVGSYSVSAVNFAGPKVQGVAMLERDLNGRPGPLGVSGTVMALAGVVGVWMVTAGRTSGGGGEEPGRRTRVAARWTAVVAVGVVLGGTLDYAGGYLPGMSDPAGAGLLTAIAGCELPANLALYLHLYRLAGRLGCGRAARPLAVCRWLVPTVIFLGAALQFGQVKWHTATWAAYAQLPTRDDWVWAVVSGGYGVIVVGTTAAATAALLTLTATAAAAGFGHWVGRMAGGAAAAAALGRRAVVAVGRDLPRWSAVAGLFGWLALLPLHATTALSGENRQGLLGSVPLVNFFGPVVAVPRMDVDRGNNESAFDVGNGSLCVVGLAMVWLVTGLRVPGRNDIRTPARWWATLAVAVPVGILLGMTAREHPGLFRSEEIAAVVTFGEVPATFLLYLHLAAVAAAAGEAVVSRRLRVLAWVLPAVIELPLLGLVFSQPLTGHYQSWPLTALAAGETVVALSLSFVAAAAVLHLAWALARGAAGRG